MVAAWLWSAANWRRTWRFLIALAALAGVVGGVAIATVAGARRASTAVDRMAERTGWPDVFVFTPSDVPAALRDALATNPRVQEATDVKVVIGGPPGFGPGEGSLIAVPAGSRFAPVVIEGRLPAAGRADEIVVTESALRTGMRVGDRVPLNGVGTGNAVACLGGSGACPLTPMGDATVTGVVRGLPDLADNTDGGLGVYADAALAEAHPEIAQSNVVMVYTDNRADALALTEELSPLLTDGDVTDGRGDASGAVQATSVEHDALLVAGLLLAITGTALFAPGYSRHLARWRSDPVVLSGARHEPPASVDGRNAAGRRRRPAVGAHQRSCWERSDRCCSPSARRGGPSPVGASGSTCPSPLLGCIVTAAVVVTVAAAVAWRWSRAAPRATRVASARSPGPWPPWACRPFPPLAPASRSIPVRAGTDSRSFPRWPRRRPAWRWRLERSSWPPACRACWTRRRDTAPAGASRWACRSTVTREPPSHSDLPATPG